MNLTLNQFQFSVISGATAYAPLPVDPFRERQMLVARDPDPSDEPAYPSLPTEVETRDGGPAETK